MNDSVYQNLCLLEYASIHQAAATVLRLGQGAKLDVASAYQIVPVHPDDCLLLGMKWQGKLYIDTTITFGLRSAPKIFTAIAHGNFAAAGVV